METQTKVRLQTLPLQDIAIGKTNPRKVFDDGAMQELTASILEKGILQPLLVRPIKDGFELVCGERRLRAAKEAGLTKVPVQIRELDDDEVLEVQLIENLERADVHPLDEAGTLQQMLDTEKYTVADLTVKLAKSETFIIQRLSLNQLIKAWKDTFRKGHINLGKALIVARLTKRAQKELAENAMDYVGGIKSKAALEQYIDRNISRKLEQAPFDPLDAKLVKKAGACTDCCKRSGANERLFPDIESDDQCFDRNCYELKVQAHLMRRARDIIQGAEPVHFIYSEYGGDIPPGLQRLLEKHDIQPLCKYDDFEVHGHGRNPEEAVPSLWINGPAKGQPENIYLPQKKKGKMQELSPEEQIARIQQREVRAKELDAEKVHKRIIEALKEAEELLELGQLPEQPSDTLLLRLCLWKQVNWERKNTVAKTFGWNQRASTKTELERLEKLTEEQTTYLLRLVAFDLWKSKHPNYLESLALRKFADALPSLPIDAIEKEQRQIARKRQKRVRERIQKLKEKC